YDRPDPGQRIAEHFNFLSIPERPRAVIHWNLYRNVALSNQLDHELKVEIETVTFQLQAAKAVPAEHLVHGKWVLQAYAEEYVDHRLEAPMPEIENHTR